MSETRSYTFLPKAGMLYSGSIEDINEIGMDSEFMASFERKPINANMFDGIELNAEQKAYVANVMRQNPHSTYQLTEAREELSAMQKAKIKMDHWHKRSLGKGRYDANIQQKLQEAYEEYQSYTADVGGDNVHQLTIVQFVNQILGHLEQPSYIASAFKNLSLDKLRGKVPEMGWPAVSIQVQRLSEPEINYTEFGQTEFRIFRNDVHIYTSREDRMEAVIDPHATSIAQGNIQMQRARELLALKELSNLVQNGTYGTLPDPTTAGTGGFRSGNDLPAAFVNVFLQHFNTYKNYLRYWIFNPLDYRAYLANWYTHAYTQIQVPEGFGVAPFFGLEKYNAIAIVSPYVPRTFVYALANEGAFELDGPYIVDAEYEPKKFADYNVVHDFIGYKIVNPARFGEKLTMPQSGVTADTEITTNLQVYNQLAPPANLVVKNASA